MSKEVLIGMLKQGNTGNEILSILDVIVTEEDNMGEYLIRFADGDYSKGELVDYQGNSTSI